MAALNRWRKRGEETPEGSDRPHAPAPELPTDVPADPAELPDPYGEFGEFVEQPPEVLRSEEDVTEEERLRARLADEPNDVEAFDRLAQIVAKWASEGHASDDPQRAADDAVWALAEEIAHNGRAWYPLIKLGQLSIENDRETALRRLATAAERDASGNALAQGLAMLRENGHPVDALNLGVGHWRPREHAVDAGRQLIEAGIEAGRHGEARRHLDALAAHPDQAGVEKLRRELEKRMAQADRDTGTIPRITPGMAPPPGLPGSAATTAGGSGGPVDVRDERGNGLLGFLRR